MALLFDLDKLSYLFTVTMLIGFAIPIFNLVTGAFGSSFDVDLELDFDLDVDGAFDGIIPISISALCVPLIIFGAFGLYGRKFMVSAASQLGVLALLLIASAIAYVLVYKFVIRALRDSTVYATTPDKLIGQEGKIMVRVTPEDEGVISLVNNAGSVITYAARIDPESYSGVLGQGDLALVVRVDGQTCYVLPLTINHSEVNHD